MDGTLEEPPVKDSSQNNSDKVSKGIQFFFPLSIYFLSFFSFLSLSVFFFLRILSAVVCIYDARILRGSFKSSIFWTYSFLYLFILLFSFVPALLSFSFILIPFVVFQSVIHFYLKGKSSAFCGKQKSVLLSFSDIFEGGTKSRKGLTFFIKSFVENYISRLKAYG